MKRLILAIVVLFAASVTFAPAASACDGHGAKKAGETQAQKKTGDAHAHAADCPMKAAADEKAGEAHEHGAACPMKDKKIASKNDVEMTGKLLCMHCNLHKEDKCRKVFQSADNAEKLYDICPGTEVDLEQLSEEGAATVTIKGKLVKAEDGTEMLKIESAKKV